MWECWATPSAVLPRPRPPGSTPRFKAALNLDGHASSLPFFPDADGKVLRQPFMELTDGPPRPPTDEDLAKWNVTRTDFDSNVRKNEERLAALMRSIAGGSYRVIVRGAKHDHFSDTFLWIPGDLETRHHTVKIVRDYTRAFFDKHLRGQTDTLLDAAKSPYDEVTVERVHAGGRGDRRSYQDGASRHGRALAHLRVAAAGRPRRLARPAPALVGRGR